MKRLRKIFKNAEQRVELIVAVFFERGFENSDKNTEVKLMYTV